MGCSNNLVELKKKKKQLKSELPYDPAILLLGIFVKKTNTLI